jgi:gamma-glutamyl:cysteine ligase YbdK (ATP-grasp superfamily)
MVVTDLDAALDRLQDLLVPGGVLVVVEWAWERFDEATARWCFARLAPAGPGAEPGRLHKHQQRWSASGQSWDGYLQDWATEEGLHPGEDILRGLDAVHPRTRRRRAVRLCRPGRYERGRGAGRHRRRQIQATGIRFTATRT